MINNRKFGIMAVGSLLAFSFLCPSAFASDKGKPKVTRFEVPTPGTIIDVEYAPGLDEWWVKCREGNGIALYSFDPQSRTWGKVIFVPKKPGPPAKETEGAQPPPPPAPEEKPAEPPEEAAPPAAPAAPEKVQPESSPGGKKKPPPEEKSWWNPMKYLDKGKHILKPPIPDRHIDPGL